MTNLNAVHAVDAEAVHSEPSRSDGAPPPGTARPSETRRYLRVGIGALVVVLVLVAVGYWLHYRATHVYTVDSRIAAREVTVSSEVAGRVTDVGVLAGDRVSAGDLLVGIDTRQAQLEIDEARAEIARIDAEISELNAQQAMLDAEIASKLNAGKAKLAAAEAAHRVSEAVVSNVESDYARADSLYDKSLISSEQFEDAREKLVSAKQRELQAGAEIDTARAEIEVIRSGKAQIGVLDRRIAALEAEKAAQKATLDRQRLDLERRSIRAAFDGVVDQTFVDVGEYVAPGRRLLMLHDPDGIWVDANFKETEFRRLALGAPATITVDAYPDREFRGEVVRLGQAATSEFALLPTPNPSGNFTKVGQRLPVRIALDQVDDLLRPGMMVEVTVDVVD